MNHSIAYPEFSVTSHEERKQSDYQLYDAIVAAVSDINLTLPSSRRLTLEIAESFQENQIRIHIYRTSQIIHSYTFESLPNSFWRLWTLLTLGFIETERVESIKADIESRYQYGPRIIE